MSFVPNPAEPEDDQIICEGGYDIRDIRGLRQRPVPPGISAEVIKQVLARLEEQGVTDIQFSDLSTYDVRPETLKLDHELAKPWIRGYPIHD